MKKGDIIKLIVIVPILALISTSWMAAMTSWQVALLLLAGHGIIGVGVAVAFIFRSGLSYWSIPFAVLIYMSACSEAITFVPVSPLATTMPIIVPAIIGLVSIQWIHSIIEGNKDKSTHAKAESK